MDLRARFSKFTVTETDSVLEVVLPPLRIRAALRTDPSTPWRLTPEGEALLGPAPVEAVAEDKPKPKRARKVDDEVPDLGD